MFVSDLVQHMNMYTLGLDPVWRAYDLFSDDIAILAENEIDLWINEFLDFNAESLQKLYDHANRALGVSKIQSCWWPTNAFFMVIMHSVTACASSLV